MTDESDTIADDAERLTRQLVALLRSLPVDPMTKAQVAQIATICIMGDTMNWDHVMLEQFAMSGASRHFRLCLKAAFSLEATLIRDKEFAGQPPFTRH